MRRQTTFTYAMEVMFSQVSVCLLSANSIARKLLIKSLRNFVEWLDTIQAPFNLILVVIRIWIRIQELFEEILPL